MSGTKAEQLPHINIFTPGVEWNAIRAAYDDQMLRMNELHRNVSQDLAQLRFQTESLQRIEDSIFHQRETLRSLYTQLEEKQLQYQSKSKLCLWN
jgi:hypothetical protein